MVVAEMLAQMRKEQVALLGLTLLELTGWLFPPPAQLTDDDSFDYIIIGGGTAGSVIATRLAQKEYNVLLVEAGPDALYEATQPKLSVLLTNSRYDWNYTSTTTEKDNSFECQVDKVVKLGIGKMLGGTGELNTMVYSRGNPKDFDSWYELTQDPIWKYNNVLPYFKKSEKVTDTAIMNSTQSCKFGNKGYIGVIRAKSSYTKVVLEGFQQAGNKIIPDIDGNRLGYSQTLYTINRNLRQGSGTRYLKRVTDSRYLAVAKNTLATKIIFHANKTVAGIQLITDDNRNIIVKVRREIIVTCGAIKSPQLLMLSGIGPREILQKFDLKSISNLPVGKNLQDHVTVFVAHNTNRSIENSTSKDYFDRASGFLGYASVSKSKNSKTVPDYAVVGSTIQALEILVAKCTLSFEFQPDMCDKLYEAANNNQAIVSLIILLHGHSRGQVLLRSTDPKDPPEVIHPGVTDERDLNSLVDYVSNYLKVEDTPAFKSMRAELIDVTCQKCNKSKKRDVSKSKEYLNCFVRCMMVGIKSYAGTCSMGTVTDSRLRVRGVFGLRVADASIMPTLVSGVAYNTVVMIGEKAADIIIEDAGKQYNSMEHEMIRPDQIQNMPH